MTEGIGEFCIHPIPPAGFLPFPDPVGVSSAQGGVLRQCVHIPLIMSVKQSPHRLVGVVFARLDDVEIGDEGVEIGLRGQDLFVAGEEEP